jgi:succinyl-diaminopimelate desuccinylase
VAGADDSLTPVAATDLVELTSELIAVPSVSGNEGAIADWVERRLQGVPGERHRVDHNVVHLAPRRAGHPLAVLAGHLDTVPAQGNESPRVERGRLFGLGATDMKAGLAVMLELARRPVATSRFDVAFVFYECEEVAFEKNGLRKLWDPLPWLAQADVAVLLEPTDCAVELGCVGSLNVEITAVGRAAHSARPWLGENAVYKALPLLERLRAMEPRAVTLAGVTYQETLAVTLAKAGIGRNVVPERFTVNVNRRYAPNRTPEEAIAEMRALVPESFEFQVVDVSPPAPPLAEQPLVAEFLSRFGLERRAKQGWTDVAQFTQRGVPAFNFGPGVPELAHRPDESLPVDNLERAYRVLAEFLS